MIDTKFKKFEEAGQIVLKFLYQRFGFNLWMITRAEGEDWIVLQSEANGYNVKPGQVFRWADSFCSHMVKGKAPTIAPRSEDIPLYASAPINKLVAIKAYIGQPLTNEDGSLFGTLCAIDPQPKSEAILKDVGIVEVLGKMLSYTLQAELREVEHLRKLERIEFEALTDVLTGLFNRRAWDKLVHLEEERCKRYGHPTAVLVIDLNDLKVTNDTFGHFAGDELIKKAASTLKKCIRTNDILARLGGDEFAILSIENNKEGAEVLLERILQAFEEVNISTAIGLAMRNPTHGIFRAIREADKKMYEHKKITKLESN